MDPRISIIFKLIEEVYSKIDFGWWLNKDETAVFDILFLVSNRLAIAYYLQIGH